MRKPGEDVIARSVAENKLGDMFAENGHGIGDRESDVSAARALLAEFPAVEFETTTKAVFGEEIRLRRLVITGPWEVDPAGR